MAKKPLVKFAPKPAKDASARQQVAAQSRMAQISARVRPDDESGEPEKFRAPNWAFK